MDVGHDKNNIRMYVDFTKLCGVLGKRMCSALLAIYTFTRCDYTADFSTIR